jgi:hypothetical protein
MRNFLPNLRGLRSWLFVVAGVIATPFALEAQSESGLSHDQIIVPGAEIAPGIMPATTGGNPDALFDIDYNYNATDSSGRNGMAAVTYFQNEFWVSRWASDTIHKFNQMGQLVSSFVVPGCSAVRAFTNDGTYIYASTNSTTIFRIDPATATLAPPNITVGGAVGAVRHCTYDSTLNGNAGGFWVGNFGTSIFSISLTGTVLSTITAATHQQTGMYGSAIDHYSAGGPYLWIFAQMAPSNSIINRLQLPAGTPTLITHDVMTDVGAAMGLTSGLAGGLCIANGVIPGQKSICGVIQGTPDNVIFGYELSDPVIADNDASLDELRPIEGYTQIPLDQIFPESFEVKYSNLGTNQLDSITIDIIVKNNGNTVFTDVQVATNVPSGGIGSVYSTTFMPASGVGTYDVWAIAHTALSQTDTLPGNDSLMFSFQVTDSTFARDDNNPDGGGGYSVNAGANYCLITANYTLNAPATVTGVWIKIINPTTGDTTRGIVTNTISGTTPDLVLSYGTPVIINASQDEYLLNIPGGVALQAGTYSFGCYQAVSKSMKLAQSPDLYTPDKNHFFVPGNQWTPSGVQTARFIRPVFGTPIGTGTVSGASNFVQMFPNPTNGNFMLAFTESATESAVVTITNPMGQVVQQQVVRPNGQLVNIDFEANASGIYFVSIDNGIQVATQKLVVSK